MEKPEPDDDVRAVNPKVPVVVGEKHQMPDIHAALRHSDSMTRSALKQDRRSGCPISISLEIFGDRWSLLVVRDLMFKGLRTFKEFAAAGEGVATNVLAERLERLEAAGIIGRAPDPADGRRVIYHLTEKGMALAPVLVEMVIWAARYEETDAPRDTVRAMRHDREAFIAGLANPSIEGRARRRGK